MAVLDSGRHACVVMPTGTGKTHVGAHLCKLAYYRTRKPAIFVAHTSEILRQTASRFLSTGWRVHIEKSVERVYRLDVMQDAIYNPTVVLASQQTLAQERRLEQWQPDDFSMLVLDECHHTPAATWQAIRQRFSTPWLGLTATPQRPGMAKLWTDVTPFPRGLPEAIEQGWLVPVELRHIEAAPKGPKRKRGNPEPKWERTRRLEEWQTRVIKTVAQSCDMPGIIFWQTVGDCEAAAEIARAQGITSAAISGLTPPRAGVLAGLGTTIQLLHLCQVGIEGMDLPQLASVTFAHPLKGWQMAQALGRGLRPLPGILDRIITAVERVAAIVASAKPRCTVLYSGDPDESDEAFGPVRLLFGDLPKPALIAIAERAEGSTPLTTSDVADIVAESEQRQRERQERRTETEEYHLTRRQRLAATLPPMQTMSGSEKRYHNFRLKWCECLDMLDTSTDTRPVKTKTASNIAHMSCRFLSKHGYPSNHGRIEAHILTWPVEVANKLQQWLFPQAWR